MTDDLLNEATRLAESDWDSATGKTLRALVERVQQAERRANFEAMRAVSESIERDAARGKLDKVRAAIDEARRRDDGDEAALRETLAAILDDKEG